ncbi:MAG TPA: glycosyltransferase [Solirubrobacteraceae bacterium]|nr:glycosyltransferase [Solirubrobacteraceae bacterium]
MAEITVNAPCPPGPAPVREHAGPRGALPRAEPIEHAGDIRAAGLAGTTAVSVVIAAYQAERFIGAALESILRQSRKPLELVVVDDGSTDRTAEVLAGFGGQLRVIRQENRGCPAAFNTAFQAATGTLIAMCGADDLWLPHKLEWQLAAAASHPEVDVFFGHALLTGRVQGEHSRPPGSGVLDSRSFADRLYLECCVCASTVMMRKALYQRIGPFRERFGADDHEYWFRALRSGARFYYDPRPLAYWRQHDTNLTLQREWMESSAREVRRWYAADVSARARAEAAYMESRRLIDARAYGAARPLLVRSVVESMRRPSAIALRALVWLAIAFLPSSTSARAARGAASLRSLIRRRGLRPHRRRALRGGRWPHRRSAQ